MRNKSNIKNLPRYVLSYMTAMKWLNKINKNNNVIINDAKRPTKTTTSAKTKYHEPTTEQLANYMRAPKQHASTT